MNLIFAQFRGGDGWVGGVGWVGGGPKIAQQEGPNKSRTEK